MYQSAPPPDFKKQVAQASVGETEQLSQPPQISSKDVSEKKQERPSKASKKSKADKKPLSNRQLGQKMASAKGWTGDQWHCLEQLWTGESNWNHTASNTSSGAHGIPQSLPANKMATHGKKYLTSPKVQIAWGLDYIKNRYGSPCAAWNFWNSQSPHWY